jgi:hypothetical protein
MALDEYVARVLAKICEVALGQIQAGHGKLVHYRQLPDAIWSALMQYWNVEFAADATERMRDAARLNAKNPVLPFEADSPPRQDAAKPELRAVTRQWLDAVHGQLEAQRLAPALAHVPQPRAAVLLGGSNRHYRFTPELANELGARLAALARDGIGLLITPSRRTDPQVLAILRAALAGTSAVIWDGAGDNPYFAYLGLADYLLVTGDSVNMVSEACATGKPVYVIELHGGSAKFQRFHAALRQAGMTRPFAGTLEQWHYAPLDDVGAVAAEICRRMHRPD